jgi:quercetin dioxygenase-like cupin family protein
MTARTVEHSGDVGARTQTRAERAAKSLAVPMQEFDLALEAARLQREDVYAKTGHDAITLVRQPDLRVVLVALRSGARIDRHRTEGRATIHVVSGELRLHAAGRTVELATGDVLALDRGVEHDVQAREDTAFLLTIAVRETEARP